MLSSLETTNRNSILHSFVKFQPIAFIIAKIRIIRSHSFLNYLKPKFDFDSNIYSKKNFFVKRILLKLNNKQIKNVRTWKRRQS